MYERFYSLREHPFSLSPDPDYLYPSKVHREALGYLRYGIEGHAGFIVITGEIGSGKTTLLQAAMRGLDSRTSVSRLVHTMLDARELIEAIMLDFGLEPGQGRSKPHLLRDLAGYLVDQRAAGRLALLVIDEAQNLSLAALEEVRMLSNLETEKSKLIQIILIGQPSLRDVLGRPELEQLRQRVTVRYHLHQLDSEETCAYINHRLRRAAIGTPLEFSRDVTDLIHLHSRGLPRKINVIADAILLFGYGEERRTIDAGLAHEALDELEATGVLAPPPPPAAAPAPLPTAWAPAAPVPAPVPPAPVPAPSPTASPPAAINPELQTYEARILQRERQLVAEQRRVLADEYRLLRLRREGLAVPTRAEPPRATSAPSRPAATLTPSSNPTRMGVPAGAVRAPRPAGPPPRRLYRDPQPSESLWARLRRGLFGEVKAVFED